MAKGPIKPTSTLALDEAFAKQDEGFIDILRSLHNPKPLAAFADKWTRDHRPWARQQIIEYIHRPWNSAGHETVVKRLFKHAEKERDDELMAHFMMRFDISVRRERKLRHRYDYRTRTLSSEEKLVADPNSVPKGASNQFPGRELFSYRTRYYLRRRGWRYFRRMGFKDPKRYVSAISPALMLYEDRHLEKGENILDSWGLIHCCFGRSDVIEFTPIHARVREGKRFGDLAPEPVFPELWQAAGAGERLLAIVDAAESRLVRVWAIDLLKRWHREGLDRLDVDVILALINHPDAEVQQFGAELFSSSKALGALPIETWLRLLATPNPAALEMIIAAMEKHVTPQRLSLAQMVEMACARPVPVVRLALRFLATRTITTDADRATVAGLSAARCESASGDVARFALSILGIPPAYDPDQVVRFFDSRLAGMREASWEWLTESSPGWNDSRLWSKLIETPYDDVRLRLVAALQHRKQIDVATGSGLWSSVLLGVHRGGRTKLIALRQVSDALRDHPEDAEKLLPVVAVAIRSVRFPEARGGLSAVVRAVDARPELEPLVSRYLPELKLNGQKAGAA
ncbi:MAG TPA: hypothetical protein VH518_02660 [Tepidisphaeraceae bacterium]|jgi:hypothetical protein